RSGSRREHRRRRRLPDRGGARSRHLHLRRLGRDARAHDARTRQAGRPGEAGTPPGPRRAPRRPPGPGPYRRSRPDPERRARRRRPAFRGGDSAAADGARRGEGIDRSRRDQPDRERDHRPGRDLADDHPGDASRHHLRRAEAGRSPQRRSRHPRQARGAPSCLQEHRVTEEANALVRVEKALDELRAGRMVILVDDADRENEGDLVLAAQHVSPEAINFMAKHGRGLICLSLTEDQVRRLALPMMVQENESTYSTAFTVSIEAAHGVTTGISAADRATTIRAAINPEAKPADVVRPGHIFPLRARKGGVLVRAGQTEGSVDLARLAGLNPAGVICEVMNEDGTMARMPDLEKFAAQHGLLILGVGDVIQYRMQRERLVRRAVEARVPTEFGGEMRCIAYENDVDNLHHVALVKGTWHPDEPILVRVHSKCLTGDIFGSQRCDCGPQLHRALQMIDEAGKGVLVYLDQEGRGIGLVNKLKAYNLQDEGADTVEANNKLGFKADLRDYGIGAQILHDCGVRKMRLMTNNPKKIDGLKQLYDLEVVERVPIEAGLSHHNADYLAVKRDKLGHLLSLVQEPKK